MKSFKQFLTEQVELKPDTTYVHDWTTGHIQETSHEPHERGADFSDSEWKKLLNASLNFYEKNPSPAGGMDAYLGYHDRHTFLHLNNKNEIHAQSAKRDHTGGTTWKIAGAVNALVSSEPDMMDHFTVHNVKEPTYNGMTARNYIKAFHRK
jgi:hypothetical protein